jgi:integrase
VTPLERDPLSDDELHALVAAVRGRGALAVRNRAMVATLAGSGLRIFEALALRPRDVDPGASAIHVRRGKGGRERWVALHPEAQPHLAAWVDYRRDRLGLDGRSPLFCSVSSGEHRRPGEPMDPSYWRRLVPELGRRAAIDKRVWLHGLRHSHATKLVRDGATLDEVRSQLGHARASTTDAYLAGLAPGAGVEALRRRWGIGR